jgi:hypothetical protein
MSPSRVAVIDVTPDNEADLLVHDASADDPTTARAISRLADGGYLKQAQIGIFRSVEKATCDDLARAQLAQANAGTTDAEKAPHRTPRRRGTPGRRLTLAILARLCVTSETGGGRQPRRYQPAEVTPNLGLGNG